MANTIQLKRGLYANLPISGMAIGEPHFTTDRFGLHVATTASIQKWIGAPILDEDTLSSNSATSLATQQSIKAYVDTYAIGAIPSTEAIEDVVGGMLVGVETFISVSYDDTNGEIDFVVPVKDEDNMISDSASFLATQQSIKAYVDAEVGAVAIGALDDIGDVTITTVAANEILQWSGSAWINQTFAEAGVALLASPTFTGIPAAPTASPGTNTTQLATTAFVAAAVALEDTLGEMGDVVITGTPADNELLAYNTATSKWINQTAAEAGVSVSGHTHAYLPLTGGTISNDLTITGDLIVNGDVVTMDVATIAVEDPLIKLAKNNTATDAVDIGFYGVYGPTPTYVGFVRDQSDGIWHLFSSTVEPTTTATISAWGDLKINSLTLVTDLAVAQGGTGASTHTSGNYLIGAGTSAITSKTITQLWAEVISSATGTLPFSKGGTGATAFTANKVIYSDGSKFAVTSYNYSSVLLDSSTIDGGTF